MTYYILRAPSTVGIGWNWMVLEDPPVNDWLLWSAAHQTTNGATWSRTPTFGTWEILTACFARQIVHGNIPRMVVRQEPVASDNQTIQAKGEIPRGLKFKTKVFGRNKRFVKENVCFKVTLPPPPGGNKLCFGTEKQRFWRTRNTLTLVLDGRN